MRSHKYSVLLRYPDYLNDGGNETYLAHVSVFGVKATPERAARAGQIQALLAQPSYNRVSADDFAVLLVCDGHINDLKE